MPSGIASIRPAITAMATSSRVRVAPWASFGSHLMMTSQFITLLAKPRAARFSRKCMPVMARTSGPGT
jgi:hypothetical protein